MGLPIQQTLSVTTTTTLSPQSSSAATSSPPSDATSPLKLFLFGESLGETKHALFDPIQNTLKTVEFPELGAAQPEPVSSGFGWLLFLSRQTSSVFFFNPFTRQRLDLPYRNYPYTAAVFTAPPTSPNCTLFVVGFDCGKVHIDAIAVGKETAWTRHRCKADEFFGFAVQAVFSNGFVYCVDLDGRVGSFDVNKGLWRVLPVDKIKFKRLNLSYLVEFEGKIVGGKKGKFGELEKLFELKFENGGIVAWEELKELSDDVDLYLSSLISFALSPGKSRKIYVGRDDPKSKCVGYDLDGSELIDMVRYQIPDFSWPYLSVWV